MHAMQVYLHDILHLHTDCAGTVRSNQNDGVDHGGCSQPVWDIGSAKTGINSWY